MCIINLCDTCLRKHGECMNDHETAPKVEYGDEGDNIVDCDWYLTPMKEQ